MTTEAPSTRPSTLRGRALRIADAIGAKARGLLIANIIAQGGIVVTGGIVRLSDSGLGCSTAPKCEPERFFPDLTDLSAHTAIEFGNRMLTGVLVVIAVGVGIAVWRTRPALRWWGLFPLAGVLAQAVLGAFTVHLKLTPILVAMHFLLSAILVWQAVWLALTHRDAPRRVGRCIKKPLRASVLVLAGVLVLGTLTTAAGPHSGDAEVTDRLDFDLTGITRAHALAVWAYVIVLAYIIVRVRTDRSTDGSGAAMRAWQVLAAITLLQGALGYIQYFNDLPEVIVGAHLAGAATLTAAHSAAFYLLRRQRPVTVAP